MKFRALNSFTHPVTLRKIEKGEYQTRFLRAFIAHKDRLPIEVLNGKIMLKDAEIEGFKKEVNYVSQLDLYTLFQMEKIVKRNSVHFRSPFEIKINNSGDGTAVFCLEVSNPGKSPQLFLGDASKYDSGKFLCVLVTLQNSEIKKQEMFFHKGYLHYATLCEYRERGLYHGLRFGAND